jgi:hypothetical protein
MPGLSPDPDAAQRQLEGLARGRQSQARGLLEALGWTVKPGHPARASSPKPGHEPGHPAVHTYPDPEPEPEPPHGLIPPEREPEHEPERPAGGFLSRLAEGLRAGVDD